MAPSLWEIGNDLDEDAAGMVAFVDDPETCSSNGPTDIVVEPAPTACSSPGWGGPALEAGDQRVACLSVLE